MIRTLAIILIVLSVSACQTTRETQRNNIGSNSTSAPPKGGFDKKNAAEKRVGMGLTYINAQNYKRAKFHLDKALTYNAKSPNVHYALGIYFQRVKEYKSAEKHFKRALSIDSKRPEFYNAYGAFLCEKGDYKDAEKMFNRAIDIPTYTDVASAFYNVGFCALKQNQIDKAAEYFRKSLNRDRRRADALIEMAKIEFSKERYARALQYVRRYEQTRTTSESAWLGLKAAHFLRDKDAIARYGIILEQRFPDSEETAEYLDNKKRWM
ncbi:type IV pilus biogenesis/stability protein PilW [Aliikangiella marina]|uniref:type IV pilus biogenesis/stability protein PilW n=1 Tax=Aliikangiella marina TaxID=1712262 RepID=UPI00163DA35E|nr:type IV pilus biogenesis/stability protein PilW [Aliikangiella marina]